jgi:hypothetical protein
MEYKKVAEIFKEYQDKYEIFDNLADLLDEKERDEFYQLAELIKPEDFDENAIS